jgi:hypothetical protein
MSYHSISADEHPECVKSNTQVSQEATTLAPFTPNIASSMGVAPSLQTMSSNTSHVDELEKHSPQESIPSTSLLRLPSLLSKIWTRTKPCFQNRWNFDILAACISVSAMVALIGVLLAYDKSQSQNLAHGITLNALIAILRQCQEQR